MIKLVTQYTSISGNSTWKGYDGGDRPFLYHSILVIGNNVRTRAPFANGQKLTDMDITEWIGVHLTNFRLELVYA